MAPLDSFLPPDSEVSTYRYMSSCWGFVNESTRLPPNAVLPTINGTQVTIDVDLFDYLNDAILFAMPEFIGFCFYVIIFGISLTASILSLHYLLNKWKKTPSHWIVATFTILICSINIALFGIRAASMAATIRSLNCPFPTSTRIPPVLYPVDSIQRWIYNDSLALDRAYGFLSASAIPIFLWISDAFLLYRSWVIWIHHRKYIALPAFTFFASVACGIVWLVQFTQPFNMLNSDEIVIIDSLYRWIPALSFSCGLDALTTGMIAGRLIHYHRKHRKSQSKFYMPIVTIFIESAALSLIAKILHLAIPTLQYNPLVVPLCTISSNLIVLRKALGADAGQMLAGKTPQDLSALRFQPRRRRGEPQATETHDGSIPGGFGAHLIRTIGGHTVDIGPLDDYNSERPSTEIQNGRKVPA